MIVDPNGRLCVCGQRGCWERYASGQLAAWPTSATVRLAGGLAATPVTVRGEQCEAAAARATPTALAVLDRFAWWVALGLVNLINLLDPEVVVLGGGAGRRPRPRARPDRSGHLVELIYAADHRDAAPHRAGGAGRAGRGHRRRAAGRAAA